MGWIVLGWQMENTTIVKSKIGEKYQQMELVDKKKVLCGNKPNEKKCDCVKTDGRGLRIWKKG